MYKLIQMYINVTVWEVLIPQSSKGLSYIVFEFLVSLGFRQKLEVLAVRLTARLTLQTVVNLQNC